MRTITEINLLLKMFEDTYKYSVVGAVQGSEAWFKLKLGVISASNAHRAVAKLDSETRLTYMAELIAQVCTGLQHEISAASLDWGNQYEDVARAHYQEITQSDIIELPFVFKDESFRVGCSPDGLVGDKKSVEIKCPYTSEVFIKFCINESVKPEWKWQNQFNMWVLQAETIDFTMFDPRMFKNPMKIHSIEKDEKMHEKLDEMIPMFISDMDIYLDKIGIPFGTQWKNLKAP